MATQLVFTVQPATTIPGNAITPAIQVTALDAAGNLDPAFTGNVTVAIARNAGGGRLAGTTTEAAVAGVATFADLSIDNAGSGYTLAATSPGLTGATSAPFAITGTATKLAFAVPPSATVAGVAISPAVQVAAQDDFGITDPRFVGNVTVAIDNNAGGGTLSGTLTKAAVAGVATFADLSIDKAGIGYTLQATSTRLTRSTSVGFEIAGRVASTVNQVLQALQRARTQSVAPSSLTVGEQVDLAVLAVGPRDPKTAKAGDRKLGYAEVMYEAGRTASRSERRLAVTRGNGQIAIAGSPVDAEPQVRVTNGSGEPVPNVTVTFVIEAGGGTIGRSTATTDAKGIAGPGTWVLGATAGVNRLKASVAGFNPVSFITTAVVQA